MKEFEVGDRVVMDCSDLEVSNHLKQWHGAPVVIVKKDRCSPRAYWYTIETFTGSQFTVSESILSRIPEDCVGVADPVNPDHYKQGGIETIDYIRAKLSTEAFRGHCIGTVLKYVSRYEHKNGLEDLKKAQVYLGWAMDTYSELEDEEEDES